MDDKIAFDKHVDLVIKQGVPREKARLVAWQEGPEGYAQRLKQEKGK